jgi:hypothetical protein
MFSNLLTLMMFNVLIMHVQIIKLVIKRDDMKTHVVFLVLIFLEASSGNNYYRNNPRNSPSFPPVGTLNNLQIQANNSVLNTLTNTLLPPGVFGNASGIFFNGTILG